MTCKLGDHGRREAPICGKAQRPADSSGRTDTCLSQHSTEQGISAKLKIKNQPLFETKLKAYKGDFLVQPKHQKSHSKSQKSKYQGSTNEVIQS